MKTLRLTIAALFAVSGWVLSQEAAAQDAGVLKSSGCLACHDAEKKKMGPAFKESAKKGLKADEVVAKMKSGKGHPKVNKPEDVLKTATEQALATK